MIVAWITCGFSLTTRRRVPLYSPRLGFKFRIIMIGSPFFRVNLCGGIPFMFTECRSSGSK
eukprot:jgi/Phyca11/128369/e_gw1.75.142.1